MEDSTICRFGGTRSSDLICTNLVYETTDIQSQKTFTDQYKMGFVVQGSAQVEQGGRRWQIVRGDAFFLPKNSYFTIRGEDNLAYFYVSFFGRRAEELVQRFGLTQTYCVFKLQEDYEELTNLAFSCLRKPSDQNIDLLSESVLLYLLACLDTKNGAPSDLLSDIISMTNNRFTDPDFSLQVLSEMLNYNAKYLSAFFKKKKGICYFRYLRDLRIKHAVFLMEQGISSVKNVALLSGFKDALYFSGVFKKEMGISPSSYISQLWYPQDK